MSQDLGKKKVRIQLDNQLHNKIIAEENEYQNQKTKPYSKIPAIKHLQDLNTYQYRPNSDIDGDFAIPQDGNQQHPSLVYEHLDKWKKDLTLKTAQNADELKRMRKEHENSLKFDQKFPQLNMEIIDSITRDPNEKQNQNYFGDTTMNYSMKSLQNLSPEGLSDYKTKRNFTTTSFSMTQLGHNTGGDTSYADNSKLLYDPNNKIYTTSQGKAVKFIQSNESIQRELNKKLINNLIFSRIQRTLEDNQITARSTKADKNDYTNNINKQRADDIFKTEMSHFSNQTLANFKNLMQTFRRSNTLIEYEELSRQLSTFLNRPRGIFENSDQKNELYVSFKDEKEEKYQFKYMEKILLENYKQLRSEINDRINEIKDMRQYSNDLQNKLTDINEQSRLFILTLEKEIESQEKAIDPNRKQAAAQITKMKKALQKMQEDKEEKLAEFKQQKDHIMSLLNQNSEQLVIHERDIKTYKEKKDITRNMLKSLYLQTLKNDKSLQKQSLVWIVRALLNINEDVTSSDLFPSIIDKQSIQYLIEYAALESNLDQVMNSIKLKLDDPSMQQQNDVFDQKYLNTQHQYNISELKDKVQKIAKKSNLKIRKPIFTQAHNKNEYMLAWENAQDTNQHEEIAFAISKVPISKVELMNSNKDARQEMKQIKIQQKKMKEAEANRLIDQFLVYKDEKKKESNYKTNILNNQNKKELKQILHILFGEIEGDDYLKLFQKKYLHLQFQIKNNKTFTFTKSNLSTKLQKEETVQQETTQRTGPLGSQTILQYRKGQNEDENKQIDQFALVKQVGKSMVKGKSDQLRNLASQKLQVPQDIIERHNKLKKIVTDGNQNNNKMFASTFFQPQSLNSLDTLEKYKSRNQFNRNNQLFASLNNLPPSLTNLSVDTPQLKESFTSRAQTSNTLYFMTQKPQTVPDLESPMKNQNLLGVPSKMPLSSKKLQF